MIVDYGGFTGTGGGVELRIYGGNGFDGNIEQNSYVVKCVDKVKPPGVPKKSFPVASDYSFEDLEALSIHEMSGLHFESRWHPVQRPMINLINEEIPVDTLVPRRALPDVVTRIWQIGSEILGILFGLLVFYLLMYFNLLWAIGALIFFILIPYFGWRIRNWLHPLYSPGRYQWQFERGHSPHQEVQATKTTIKKIKRMGAGTEPQISDKEEYIYPDRLELKRVITEDGQSFQIQDLDAWKEPGEPYTKEISLGSYNISKEVDIGVWHLVEVVLNQRQTLVANNQALRAQAREFAALSIQQQNDFNELTEFVASAIRDSHVNDFKVWKRFSKCQSWEEFEMMKKENTIWGRGTPPPLLMWDGEITDKIVDKLNGIRKDLRAIGGDITLPESKKERNIRIAIWME